MNAKLLMKSTERTNSNIRFSCKGEWLIPFEVSVPGRFEGQYVRETLDIEQTLQLHNIFAI